MPPSATTFYDRKVDRLHTVLARIHAAFTAAGVEYRVVGGMAAYFHVAEVDPLAARLTRDVDLAVRRVDLERIAAVAPRFGFRYRHAAGVDLLQDVEQQMEQIHFIFAGEKVEPDYLEPAPEIGDAWLAPGGYRVTPVASLVRMKLTSFRLKDQVHLQDLDGAGLITAEVEATLPEALRRRLAEVRAKR